MFILEKKSILDNSPVVVVGVGGGGEDAEVDVEVVGVGGGRCYRAVLA